MRQAIAELRANRFSDAVTLIDHACRIDHWQVDLQVLIEGFAADPVACLWEKAQGLEEAGCRHAVLSDILAWSATRLGLYDEVRRYLNYRQFLRSKKLPPIDDTERAQLIQELLQEVSLYDAIPGRSPHFQAQRHGLYENDPRTPAVSRAFSRLRPFVEEYCLSLADGDLRAPFVARRPKQFKLNGWSVISGPRSFHTPHFHANSWASGVYYISIPDFVRNSAEHAGWYRAGRPFDDRQVTAEQGWPEIWVCPENDLALIGTSYFFHETVPLNRDEVRIGLAFDVKWDDQPSAEPNHDVA